jgi:hypothetical protein
MRDLAEEDAALVVHTFDDRFPGFDLLLRPDGGSVRKSVALARDAGAFRDEKPARCGALCVVEPVVRVWDAAKRAGSCQRGQHYSATTTSQIVNSSNLSTTLIDF